MKNTINNQELVKEYCGECGHLNLLKSEYKLQDCEKCGSKVLITRAENIIKVISIEKVDNVNIMDELYDFQMFFGFQNDKEINEFLDKEMSCHHLIYCEVDCEDGVFNLDTARWGVSLFAEYSFDYKFSKEQVLEIKDNVIEYILSNNLGKIKGRDRHLLEKVCNYYGCGLTINDNSVVLEDFIDAEFKYVSDALIHFYKDFLKEDWNVKSDLEYIEDLIEEKAFNTVLNWMDAYQFVVKLREKNMDTGIINLKVKDLQAVDSEYEFLNKTLDQWCIYFIEEIYNKSVPDEVREEWILNDANPMQDYLDRNKPLNLKSKYLAMHYHGNLEDKKAHDFINSAKFEVKYQLDLSLRLENGGYKIYSDFPIIVVLDGYKLESVNKFFFTKSKDYKGYKFIYCENIKGERVYARDIKSFANMMFSEFYRSCAKLCKSSIKSYLQFDDKIYEINNIVDFLKLENLEEIEVSNIDFNFDISQKENRLLRKYIDQYSGYKFREVLSAIKKDVIFDKDIEVVAKKYLKCVLNFDDAQLKYMDYVGYFKNEVSYEKVDDYIVVYI